MSQWGEIRKFNGIEFICSVNTNTFDNAKLCNIVDWIDIMNCPSEINDVDKKFYFHLIEKEFLNKSYRNWLNFDLTNLKEYNKNQYEI